MTFNPAEPRDKNGKWTLLRALLKKTPIASKNVVDMYHQATPGEAEGGRVWYPNAHLLATALGKRYNVTTREAAGLLATYSPQTPWGQNVRNAAEVLREGHGIGGPGAHLWWHKDPAAPFVTEEREGVMAPGLSKARAEKIVAGVDFEDVFAPLSKTGKRGPSALKIRAFAELIANGHQVDGMDNQVVIDRHAAGVARGIAMTEDMYSADGPSGSIAKFTEYNKAYTDAADVLSKELGRVVTPEEVQATTWLVRQRLNQAGDGTKKRTRKSLGAIDTERIKNYVKQYLPEAELYLPHTGYENLALPVQLREVIDLAHWEEALHPRGKDGRFLGKGKSIVSKVGELKAEWSYRESGGDKPLSPLAQKVRDAGREAYDVLQAVREPKEGTVAKISYRTMPGEAERTDSITFTNGAWHFEDGHVADDATVERFLGRVGPGTTAVSLGDGRSDREFRAARQAVIDKRSADYAAFLAPSGAGGYKAAPGHTLRLDTAEDYYVAAQGDQEHPTALFADELGNTVQISADLKAREAQHFLASAGAARDATKDQLGGAPIHFIVPANFNQNAAGSRNTMAYVTNGDTRHIVVGPLTIARMNRSDAGLDDTYRKNDRSFYLPEYGDLKDPTTATLIHELGHIDDNRDARGGARPSEAHPSIYQETRQLQKDHETGMYASTGGPHEAYAEHFMNNYARLLPHRVKERDDLNKAADEVTEHYRETFGWLDTLNRKGSRK